MALPSLAKNRRRLSFKKTAGAVIVLVAAVVLAGCSDDSDDSGDGGMAGMDHSSQSPTTSAETGADFNDADVTFATEMIPHHRQAVEMAELAGTRAQSQEVKDLAAEIEGAQGPEIETMTSWLQEWGQPVPEDMSGMDMSEDMPGMMSMEDMDELESLSGAAFDKQFLTMMIAHHEGAIEMAKTEQADGQNSDAITLAEQIEEAQTTEITTMNDLLG